MTRLYSDACYRGLRYNMSRYHHDLNPMKTALLVIDVQVGIVDYFQAYNKGQVLANINDLLTRARAGRIPVIYVRHEGGKGDPLEAHTEGWAIHQRIAPVDGEPIVDKQSCSSFYETPLRAMLEEKGISHLIVTGCQTEYCIDTACRHATTLGYDVTLAGDAHTTIDNDLLKAEQIIAHHNNALNGFSSGKYTVTVKPAGEIAFPM
jgi:nicotinamidase-related amidase